jgi:hypothetical protein
VVKCQLINRMYIFWIAVFLTSILSIILLVRYLWKYLHIEGFNNESSSLESIMALIRRTSSRLLDLNMWKERIIMSSMSPVELARYHLQSSAKSEDATSA